MTDTTLDAILLAVLADPQDDAPRLKKTGKRLDLFGLLE